MDHEGIDMAVLFPSRGLFTLGADGMDPALATAISRAYNDWLAEFCAGGSDRMFGAGMIPPHDIEGAISEARRAVNELGFKTVFVRPNPVNGRNWHDAYYDPLWAEIERLGMPLSFHEGGRVHLPQPGDNFDTHMLSHTCTHPLGMMLAAVDIVGGGVLERFPGLSVAFLEGNCSWAPWLLWRLDEHYEMSAAYDHPDLTMEPSAYFRRQCYLSVECDETPAAIVSSMAWKITWCSPPTIPTPTPSTRKPWSASWNYPFPARRNASSCGTTAPSSTDSTPDRLGQRPGGTGPALHGTLL